MRVAYRQRDPLGVNETFLYNCHSLISMRSILEFGADEAGGVGPKSILTLVPEGVYCSYGAGYSRLELFGAGRAMSRVV